MTTSEVCTRYIESDNPAGEIVWMARQSGCKPSEIIYVLNCCGLETPINIPDEGEVLDRGRDMSPLMASLLTGKDFPLSQLSITPKRFRLSGAAAACRTRLTFCSPIL